LARMEAKMDSRQEEMKAQLGSLASLIDAKWEELNVKMDATEDKMNAWIEEMKDGQK
jgi:acetolactate synthase small subunit